MTRALIVDEHPLLDAIAFETTFPSPLGECATAGALDLTKEAAPVASSDAVRAAVRDLLRHGGYKPTGRGKPASEYLLRAVPEGALSTINLAVDVCNVVSFHSGLPISVVDDGRLVGDARLGIAPAGSSYVFNASGQTIDVGGLLCLFDAEGPTANAVKDSQRTKTSAATITTLTVLWGTRALPGHAEETFRWYERLLVARGAEVVRVGGSP